MQPYDKCFLSTRSSLESSRDYMPSVTIHFVWPKIACCATSFGMWTFSAVGSDACAEWIHIPKGVALDAFSQPRVEMDKK